MRPACHGIGAPDQLLDEDEPEDREAEAHAEGRRAARRVRRRHERRSFGNDEAHDQADGDHGRQPPRQRRLRPSAALGAVAPEQAAEEQEPDGVAQRVGHGRPQAMPDARTMQGDRDPGARPQPRWPPSRRAAAPRGDPDASRVPAESRTPRTPPRQGRSSRSRWSRDRFRSRRYSFRVMSRGVAKHRGPRPSAETSPRPTISRISATGRTRGRSRIDRRVAPPAGRSSRQPC